MESERESPVSTLETLLSDLGEESSELDALVADLTEQRWATPTTPEGWTVAHQVGHLIRTDEMSLRAIDDPDGFFTFVAEMRQQGAGQRVDVAAELAALPAALLLERWRQSRRDLAEALKGVPSGAKIAWAGPPMSAASMATARVMETWAHSLDVHDAFGMETFLYVLMVLALISGFVSMGLRETAPAVRHAARCKA